MGIMAYQWIPKLTRFFIIDAHRPIHYKNLSVLNASVVVFMLDKLVANTQDLINTMNRVENQSLLYKKMNKQELKEINYNKSSLIFTENSEAKNELNSKISETTLNEKLNLILEKYYSTGYYWGIPTSFIAY